MPTPFEIHLNKLRDLKKSLAKCSRPKAQRHIKTLIVAEETRWQLKGSDEEPVARKPCYVARSNQRKH